MPPSQQPIRKETILPTELPLDSVPVIAMDANDLEAPTGVGSSPELSKEYLYPPGLDVEEERHVFVLSDVVNEDDKSFEPWPAELAGVDINIAPDGTYIETSSGPAARELKRRYDQRFGVSLDVRSPYAITAFVNQHGKQMFRVGHRELSAPAASAAEAAAEIEGRLKSSTEVSQSPPRTKRRSRMSMVGLFPPNVFTSHRPTASSSSSSAPKKLRKARSIPDMASIGGSEASEHGELSSGPSGPTHTGRAHSQSVTAMDMPRLTQSSLVSFPPRNSDIFGDVMDWFTPASSAATSFSSQSFLSGTPSLVHTEDSDSRPIIAHPFGVGVSFDTPLKKPSSFFDHLPPPRHVRLMQSFESGMTARQDDTRTSDRPPSAIRITEPSSSRPSSTYEPPAEASLLSEYASTVFDVLQTYRGLPNLDKLVEHDTTVKISLSSDLSAVPRDDPRFVIWGEPSADYYDFDVRSSSRDSIPSDSASRRRGSKTSRPRSSVPSTPPGTGVHRILLAATIERWIAQLTSDLNYDELLDFFLTYRTYISGVDLAHLLISRFQWALQLPKNKQDQSVRQIVRVRTFVAIRYWLLTFFTVDFIPNRELRLLMSNWLNTLIRDPLLKEHSDGLGIARRLVKVAKEAKRIHIRTGSGTGKERGKSPPPPKQERSTKSHLFGQKFAEAVMKDSDEDSDVDLDFLPDEATQEDAPSSSTDPANAHIAAGHVGALAPSRPTSLPLSSFNILQRIDQSPVPTTDTAEAAAQLAISLPMHNSALSRAFVKTIGRLGRLKRVLHSRSNTRTSLSPCTGVSAFDLELSVPRDLGVNAGVGHYLKGIESSSSRPAALDSSQQPPKDSPVASTAPDAMSAMPSMPPPFTSLVLSPAPPEPMTPTTPTAPHFFPQQLASDSTSTFHDKPTLSHDPARFIDNEPSLPTSPPDDSEPLAFEDSGVPPRNGIDNTTLAPSFRPESVRSFASSTGSLGEVLDDEGRMFGRPSAAYEPFDIVSLDDFDMSDTSSEVHGSGPSAPPGLGGLGLKKQTRKLPMRKDFEFLPRRSEVSSMGIVSRASVVSDTASSSTSSVSVGIPLGGNIQQWQMNALLDSLSVNEEDGDVDAALKRLEGQINPQKMQEKRSKVDGWVKQIQARLAAGDYEDEEPRFPIDSDEENGPAGDDDDTHESVSQHNIVLYPPRLDDLDATENATPPATNQQGLTIPQHSSPSSSEVGSIGKSEDAKPAVEDAVPIEILRSRVSTILPPAPGPDFPVNIQSKFAAQEAMRMHQSFILSYRAVTLAEQFAMIDRELFMGVKFEELVTEEQWMATEEVNVYDWSQYLKDRATWKAEHRNTEKTTALAAVRARFNLLANFVISEIVLTQPSQRPMVVAKFIRIAWKSYQLSNFNGLVAIIAALQSDTVVQAMRKSAWNKVGTFETRVYRDLKVFVSGASDFALVRSAVEAIVENKNKTLDGGSHASSIVGSSADSQSKPKSNGEARSNTPTACVPFIGIYLAQLHRLKRLPDLIDPTSPNEAVGMNSTTGDFDPPAHPEVFDALSPLPPTMRIEPLVNVHKQRKIAAVIKSLVAGQHVASRVNFELDKKLFQRCLRLRALEPDMVQRALAV